MEGAKYVSDDQLVQKMKGWAQCQDPGYEGKYFSAEILEVIGAPKKSKTKEKEKIKEKEKTKEKETKKKSVKVVQPNTVKDLKKKMQEKKKAQ